MKIYSGRTSRGMLLLAGAMVAATSMLSVAPAQAADKSKNYKTGAIVLGAASAYFILKGKTVPAVAAGAGAYYAYKKSEDAKNDYRYDDDYYSQYPNDYDRGGYDRGGYNRGGYGRGDGYGD